MRYLIITFLIVANFAYSQNCNPSASIQSVSGGSIQWKKNKVDTVAISVRCFESCDLVLESSLLKIRSLGNKIFAITPLESGEVTVDLYTTCPKGTIISFSKDSKLDVSGKRPITQFNFSVTD